MNEKHLRRCHHHLPTFQVGKERFFFPACPWECFSKFEGSLFNAIPYPIQEISDLLLISWSIIKFSGADDSVAEVVEVNIELAGAFPALDAAELLRWLFQGQHSLLGSHSISSFSVTSLRCVLVQYGG